MDRAFQRSRSLMLCGTFYSVPPTNIACGLPANNAEAIIIENKILFDEILKKSFFINLKFKINNFIVFILLYTLFDKLTHLMSSYP